MTTTRLHTNIHSLKYSRWNETGARREEKLQSTAHERNMQFLIKILFRGLKSFSADI